MLCYLFYHVLLPDFHSSPRFTELVCHNIAHLLPNPNHSLVYLRLRIKYFIQSHRNFSLHSQPESDANLAQQLHINIVSCHISEKSNLEQTRSSSSIVQRTMSAPTINQDLQSRLTAELDAYIEQQNLDKHSHSRNAL